MNSTFKKKEAHTTRGGVGDDGVGNAVVAVGSGIVDETRASLQSSQEFLIYTPSLQPYSIVLALFSLVVFHVPVKQMILKLTQIIHQVKHLYHCLGIINLIQEYKKLA